MWYHKHCHGGHIALWIINVLFLLPIFIFNIVTDSRSVNFVDTVESSIKKGILLKAKHLVWQLGHLLIPQEKKDSFILGQLVWPRLPATFSGSEPFEEKPPLFTVKAVFYRHAVKTNLALQNTKYLLCCLCCGHSSSRIVLYIPICTGDTYLLKLFLGLMF